MRAQGVKSVGDADCSERKEKVRMCEGEGGSRKACEKMYQNSRMDGMRGLGAGGCRNSSTREVRERLRRQ